MRLERISVHSRIRKAPLLAALAATSVVSAATAQNVGAFTPAPKWSVTHQAHPTKVAPGGESTLRIAVENVGAAASSGPVTVTARLPAGLTATAAGDGFIWDCPGAAGSTVVRCTLLVGSFTPFGPDVPAHASAPALTIRAAVDAAARTATSNVTVSGGGATEEASSTATVDVDTASAGFGIAAFRGRALDLLGQPARQAGSHPDVTTEISFNTALTGLGGPGVVRNVKDIEVDLPRGLTGDPTAVPTCRASLVADPSTAAQCPPETQVGIVEVTTAGGPTLNTFTNPIYNVDPPRGLPGRFSFNVNGVVVNLDPTIRTGGDYGITARISRISQTLATTAAKVTLWGVPADAAHNGQRFLPNPFGSSPPAPSTEPRRPFMTAPTECSGQALVTRMRATSWTDPGTVHSASFSTDYVGLPLTAEGCDRLRFDPGFAVRAESAAKRGAPAGIGIDLTVPQNENPDGLATAHLKTARVTLPEGMVVNASSAQGLQACAPEQIKIDSPESATCPEASKIGSMEVVTPLLRDPLEGGIYLAAQRRNPFGTTLALYLVAEGSGVTLKLPGRIDPDPATGRITATFDDNPQLPFDRLSLHFKTGPRAPLSLPARCGPATTTAVLTPWSGTAPVTVNTTFEVSADGNGAPCPPRGFAPAFTAGSVNPVAGADSTFTLGFSRTDDDQELNSIAVDLPEGLLARIASRDLCAEAQAAAGTCGESSRIGSVTAAAGAGSNPFALPGRAYITGPYRGAPFGLSIVVPAIAGPFDLGTVVVRAAVHVDRRTTALRIVSEPMPTILEGIPLQIRLVEIAVDQPGFMLNPTDCSVARIAGAISSIAGAVAGVSSRYQVGDCAALRFTPRMSLRVGSKGRTSAGKTTPLQVVLRMSRGQANNRVVAVTLPRTLNSRLAVVNLRNSCSQAQFAAERCPRTIGSATAVTPLLRDRLRGSIYLVQTGRRSGLPNMVVALKGQVDVDLTGRITIDRRQRVKTTFDTVPDVPISSFTLNLTPGRNGAVGVVRNLCVRSNRRVTVAQLAFTAQNGKRVSRNQAIAVRGCGARATPRGRRGGSRRARARRGSARR